MPSKKRTRDGEVKPQSKPQTWVEDITMIDSTQAQEQCQDQSRAATVPQSVAQGKPDKTQSRHQIIDQECIGQASKINPSKTSLQTLPGRNKLPKLPKNATVSKRSLLHPAIPSPFSSSSSPKVIYVTASSPYVPAIKRVRALLAEALKRSKQSSLAMPKRKKGKAPLEATGSLSAADVEHEIANEVGRRDVEAQGEAVCMKATGRAIPRALEIGLHFQGEGDCWVRMQMGSVKAIDDVELEGEEDGSGPRIRTISSITVSVGLR